MGGLSNMALWLQLPLTSPAEPTALPAAATAACSGSEGTPSSSKPALANGHQPSQGSATQAQAGEMCVSVSCES